MNFLLRTIRKKEHFFWVVAQQFAVRGLTAIKFFFAAKMLGPESFAQIGVGLLAVAMVESLTDTGMQQAVIQKDRQIDRVEAGAVWTLQLIRGAVLAFFLFLVSPYIAAAFSVPGAAGLIAVAAALPLVRNCLNPGYFSLHRSRNFRAVCCTEASSVFFDCLVAGALLISGFGPMSVIIGCIVFDSLKVLSSWMLWRVGVSPNIRWADIADLTSFGKWVWGASAVTFVLNQLDKFLVARFLGATEFGLYQLATKIAQLFISDAAFALGQYLLPNFSREWRESKASASAKYRKVSIRVFVGATAAAVALQLLCPLLIPYVLGPAWEAAVEIVQILAIGMSFNASIAVVVAFSRAIGFPKLVTQATFLQLIVLAALSPMAIHIWGLVGMAVTMSVCWLITVIYLRFAIKKAVAE